jgi:hypothetical protein
MDRTKTGSSNLPANNTNDAVGDRRNPIPRAYDLNNTNKIKSYKGTSTHKRGTSSFILYRDQKAPEYPSHCSLSGRK